MSFISFASTTDDEYITSIDYFTGYTLKGSNEFYSLGRYSVGSQEYLNDWSVKNTWTINTTPVSIYSIVNKYNSNDYVFSIQPIIENNNVGQVNTFKVYDMHCFLYYKPEHILTEANIKCTFVNHLPIELMSTHHVRLQGKQRASGEWVTLKQWNIESNNSVMYLEWSGTDEHPSFQYSEYRINVLYWNFTNNGLTLISNGEVASQQKLCSIDFVGVETNEWEKKLDELVNAQNSIILKLGDISDDIRGLPSLILEGIYDLFVPDDLADKFNGFIDELLDDMGILGFPFEFALMELQAIAEYNPISTIDIPDIEFMGHTWLEDFQFDFNSVGDIELLGFNEFTLIYVVRLITSYLLAMSLIYRLKILLYDFGILKNPNDDIGGDI